MRRTLTAPGVDGAEEVVVFESTPHLVYEHDVLGIEVAKGDYEALKVFYTKNKREPGPELEADLHALGAAVADEEPEGPVQVGAGAVRDDVAKGTTEELRKVEELVWEGATGALWDWVAAVNTKGALLVSKEAAKWIPPGGGGWIVNITTTLVA
jgi:NAD(P)-dependent dehydrogenase (short-subunit alcohol dehydrogenase family)